MEGHSGEIEFDLFLCDLINAVAAFGVLGDFAEHVGGFGELKWLELVLADFDGFADVVVKDAGAYV